THLEAISRDTGKVTRQRNFEADLGRVTASPSGDGFYCRSTELRFVPFPEGAERQVASLPGGGSPTQCAVAADGKNAFVSSRGQIWKIATENGQRETVPVSATIKLAVADRVRPKGRPTEVGDTARPQNLMNPRLSPNGRKLIFAAAGRLWQQGLDGGPPKRLLDGNAWERDPAFSPDGRQLAYVQSLHGRRSVRVLDLDTKQTRTLVELGDSSWAISLSWSGDGKRLLYEKTDALFLPRSLVAVNLADGKPEQLASVAADGSPRQQFSADGNSIYYTSRTDGVGTLYRMSLKMKPKPEAVSQLARHLHAAAVSPDEKWLAF